MAVCIDCGGLRSRRSRAYCRRCFENSAAAILNAARGIKTHCKRGHEFTPKNTQLYRGKRRCLSCHAMRHRTYRLLRVPERQRDRERDNVVLFGEYPWGESGQELVCRMIEVFRYLPDSVWGDACEDAIVDVLSGTVTVSEVEERRNGYVQRAFHDYLPAPGSLSLEKPITKGGASLRDLL